MTSETKEAKILREMRMILTEIARETAVRRGDRHILSIETIARMRDCLGLISDREKELNESLGIEMTSRPKLGGDKPNTVRVKLREIK
ncbi:MAG: segregation and condensation protein A [Acidiferrobacteraceae bacterium]|nr:segregation and condensation protein A [Acidiferrobacteraceae bacterium]|tara:strand:- start:651 stop:914 length:264 start_codon:yes stop_codon:yes gene_type:complete